MMLWFLCLTLSFFKKLVNFYVYEYFVFLCNMCVPGVFGC